MKKLILLFVIATFSLGQLVAQESYFNKGDKVINLGIGMGTVHSSPFAAIFSGAFDLGIIDKVAKKGVIGVGGYIGYSTSKYNRDWRTSDLLIAARGTFHYPLVKKLDTYAGLLLGYDIGSYKWVGTGNEGVIDRNLGGPVSSLFAGVRYYFTNNIAGFSEIALGYGPTNINFGVSFKF